MSTYAFSKPTYGQAFPVSPFGVTFYVSNTTNPRPAKLTILRIFTFHKLS